MAKKSTNYYLIKKIVTYPKELFDKEARPYVGKEWDEKGKEVYSK